MILDLSDGVAPDGSPIAVYLSLPASDDADLIHRALPSVASVLELGCGTGRISQWLAERGHQVFAVDQSAEMLKYVVQHPRITPMRCDIERLALDWKFDAVLLPSYLVNTADRVQRSRFLASCRRHVSNDGIVIIQRVNPTEPWTQGAASWFGPVRVELLEVTQADHVVQARIEYQVGARTFEQAVVAEILDDAAMFAELAQAKLKFDRWLDPSRMWLGCRRGAV